MESKKKKRIQLTYLQNRNQLTDFEKLMVTKGNILAGGKDGLGVWDGNVLKLGCDDGCTTINIIKFIEFRKIKIKKIIFCQCCKKKKEKNYEGLLDCS